MLKKLCICVFFFSNVLVDADEDMNTVYNNCITLEDSYSCSQYKLMKFIKKLEMDSPKRNSVIRNVNDTDIKDPLEKVTKLMKLLKNLLYPTPTSYQKKSSFPISISSQQRSADEVPQEDLSKGMNQYFNSTKKVIILR